MKLTLRDFTKNIAVGLATIPSAFALSAAVASAQEVTLRVDAAASIYSEMFNELAQQFEAQNPKIRIVMDTSSRDQIEEFQKTLRQAVVNDLPDVSFQGPNYLKVLVDNQYVNPVDSWISSDPEWTEEKFSTSVTRSAQIGGRTMGLAVGFSFPVIYYNVDLVKEAQGGDAALPDDWGGILRVAKRIKELHPNILPIYAQTTSLYSQGLIRSLGGRIGDESGRTVTLIDPKTLAAITVLQRIGALGQGESAMTGNQARQAFSAGQTAIHVDSSSSLRRFLNDAVGHFELATAKLPLAKNGELSTSGFILVMHTKDAKKQELAWRFMKFVASADGQKIIGTKTGFVPGNEVAVKMPEILGNYYSSIPQIKPVLDSTPFAAPWYLFEGSNNERIRKIFEDAMEGVVLQKIAPEDAARGLTKEITPLIGNK